MRRPIGKGLLWVKKPAPLRQELQGHENADKARNASPGGTGRHHDTDPFRRAGHGDQERARRPLRAGSDGCTDDPGELGRQRANRRGGMPEQARAAGRLAARRAGRQRRCPHQGRPRRTVGNDPADRRRAGVVHLAGDLLLRVRRAADEPDGGVHGHPRPNDGVTSSDQLGSAALSLASCEHGHADQQQRSDSICWASLRSAPPTTSSARAVGPARSRRPGGRPGPAAAARR